MSSYRYLPLPSKGEYIRLLCLLPNESEAGPLQCKLHNYSLQTSGLRTHRYEALSYVWGNPRETLPIYVGKDRFLVTVNLHAALSRLRDHSFERIICVDAICINQNNSEEQGQQVQLMAKIYSSAHRVIVWLGEKAEDTDGALENICFAANEKSTEHSKKETILNLLQRPWFQRIWVLQEVAAARHVVMMCGLIEIDGYAFCVGLKSLELSYAASPELQTYPSVTYLIERAGLRSNYTANSPEKFSLNIRCLAELIDMFHTRKATEVRDKVYALLGMSSDNPDEAGLQPDYELPWKDLFQQLVKFVLGKDVSVETSDGSQRAVIKSKGCILGQVSRARSDDRQNVNITFTSKNATWCLDDEMEWTLQASAKFIQERDIICFLQGASKPTIIRLYKDHFAIIVIAVTPLKESGSPKQVELSKSITHFSRDFLLVWDWEQPLEESQDLEESKNWMSFDQATNIWNVALILGDLEEFEKAEKRLREAIKGYEIAFGEEQSILKSQYGLTPLLWAVGNGYIDVVNLLLAKDGIDPDLKDNQYSRTPLSWAAENGQEAIVKLLLETGKVEVDSKDNGGPTPLWWAAKKGHEAIVKLLLETGKVEVDSKDNRDRTPLSWATEKGHEAVVKLLRKHIN
ncbi:heterokaryon incompatibility protein-domain-containing protein [Leptodontidium sp. MPI-SDFR-AT-0119]|nr:heterokaryon incompatibility protein-domain-containing protein [Leptodontidium sp. MPI-SDFR-AT-0119]